MKWGPRGSRICIGNMAQNLLTPALTVFEQMALDDVLAHAPGTGPVLRFYHWTDGPAVTFGCSQFYRAVKSQLAANAGPVCRRPTGGGIVYHGADVTFSLIFQSALRPAEIYAQLHGAIEQALAQQQLCSMRQSAVDTAAYIPTQDGIAKGCFASPVQDDLLVAGQKILGGAIRRFGSRVLYQGSLQYRQARSNPVFRRAISAGAERMLGVKFEPAAITDEMLQQAKMLAAKQYQTADWTEKIL